MTFVLLSYEKGGKFKWYEKDVDISRSATRKCECPFRLRGKPAKVVKGGWLN